MCAGTAEIISRSWLQYCLVFVCLPCTRSGYIHKFRIAKFDLKTQGRSQDFISKQRGSAGARLLLVGERMVGKGYMASAGARTCNGVWGGAPSGGPGV